MDVVTPKKWSHKEKARAHYTNITISFLKRINSNLLQDQLLKGQNKINKNRIHNKFNNKYVPTYKKRKKKSQRTVLENVADVNGP